MLVIEIPKSNEELIADVINIFDNCEIIEMNSLGADTVIQIFVPTITVTVPAATAIIVQILKSAKTNVKYNNIEVSGTPKNISKIIQTIKSIEENKNDGASMTEGEESES